MKLENLTLHKESGSESIKLIDFGISKQIGEDGTALFKERSGTNGYIAPEMKGKDIRVSTAIDIWSLGVIIYEMSVAYKPTAFRNY